MKKLFSLYQLSALHIIPAHKLRRLKSCGYQVAVQNLFNVK